MFFPVANNKDFHLTDNITEQARFTGNCTKAENKATTINLQYDWQTMNGNQKIVRKLKMTFLAKDGTKTASLVSTYFLHELKENMTEYIVGNKNTSQSSPTLPLVVNLETEYIEPSRTTALTSAILTVEHLKLVFPKSKGVRGGYSLYEQFQDSFVVGVHIIFFVPIG